MLKRKAETTLTREGEMPKPEYSELDIGRECTPEEIQKRRIFRARRPLRQLNLDRNTGFKLKLNLMSAEQEASLLTPSKAPLSISLSPQVPFSSSEVLPKMLSEMSGKDEEEIKQSFLETKAPERSSPSPPKLESPEINKLISVEATLSVDSMPTKSGFLELSLLKQPSKKPLMIFAFRSTLKNVLYQAVLTDFSIWTACRYLSAQDGLPKVEMQIQVLRNTYELVVETCKVAVLPDEKIALCKALDELKHLYKIH